VNARAGAPGRPPVVLLTGVGLTAAAGARTADALAAHFRVLMAPIGEAAGGGSDSGAEATVDGALALLEATGVWETHIVGLSFGGMIAQEIAIRHPDRVQSLVLGASSAGGDLCVPPDRPIRDFVRDLGDAPVEEALWGAVPYIYAPRTRHRDAARIGEDMARRLTHPLDPGSFTRQRAAAQAHDAGDRLTAVTAPTLVVHGEEDRILPPENGRRLAAAIAGARLIALPHGAHAFPTDVPEVNRELVRFLRDHSRPRRATAGRRSGRAGRA
jgi:pimeloyl-ACP methyl ester carboxylesterase